MPSWISLLTDSIHACNPALANDFRQWLWPSGTCFLDERLWWGKQKKRIAPHEGVDLACSTDQQGKKRQVTPGLLVPTMFSGRVVQLHQDFLNWSLYIRHDQFCRDGSLLQLHTVYGHVQPKKTVYSGMEVRAGETVAVLDAYSRSAVPLHLHFTVAWIPKSIPPDQLKWQMLSENSQIILLDPLAECEVEGWKELAQPFGLSSEPETSGDTG